eukprot:767688-Hanusia_phi.AAC.12
MTSKFKKRLQAGTPCRSVRSDLSQTRRRKAPGRPTAALAGGASRRGRAGTSEAWPGPYSTTGPAAAPPGRPLRPRIRRGSDHSVPGSPGSSAGGRVH